MKMDSEKERELCYAAAILCAKLSNPNNLFAVEGLIPSSVEQAKLLIQKVYEGKS